MFILEVDGPYHTKKSQILKDKRRDSLLQQAGFNVVRLPANEVTLERLKHELFLLEIVPKQAVRDRLFLAAELLKYPQFRNATTLLA